MDQDRAAVLDKLAQWDQQFGQSDAAEDTRIRRIEPGDYTLEVVAGDVFETSKGTPGYGLTCKSVVGPEVGGRVRLDMWASEKGWPITMRDLRDVFGVTVTRRTDLGNLDLAGRRFKARASDEAYDSQQNGPSVKTVLSRLSRV
jgi:hypothetical protein